MKTTDNTNIFKLVVVTAALYGASIFRNRYDMNDLAHSVIISCSSQQRCQSILL